MQETQNAEKYSFGNESGLGGPVWAQIWSESILAESRKPLKPLAGSKTAIKKTKNPKIPEIRKSENFRIFHIKLPMDRPGQLAWLEWPGWLEITM